MSKLILLLGTAALMAQASIFPILSDTASSGSGVWGTGTYGSGVSVFYALDQYDQEDVGATGLSQSVYFRYFYEFSVTSPQTLRAQRSASNVEDGHFILALPADCGNDAECLFGLQVDGVAIAPGDYLLHNDLGVDPIFGVKLNDVAVSTGSLTLSFFSNRIPDGNGRIYMRRGEDYLVSEAAAVITPNSRVQAQDTPADTAVPEPISAALFAGGLLAFAALGGMRRNRR